MKAGGVYLKYKQPFLNQIDEATSKELLLRAEDVQVLHGFATEAEAKGIFHFLFDARLDLITLVLMVL